MAKTAARTAVVALPTVAAFLSILFSVTNGHPPGTTLEIPATFVRDVMEGIGLAAREIGLSGILTRVQCAAAAMKAPGPG